jgi:hypothetical protein
MKVEQNEAGRVVMIDLDDEPVETTIDLTNPVMLALRAEVEAILARAAVTFWHAIRQTRKEFSEPGLCPRSRAEGKSGPSFTRSAGEKSRVPVR